MLATFAIAVVIIALAMKVDSERIRHAGNWMLVAQIALFDIVVGVIFLMFVLCRILEPSLLHVVSMPLLAGLAVVALISFGVRTYVRSRIGAKSEFRRDFLTLLTAMTALSILRDMAATLPHAGGH
ncbi:hypothetical protein [Burkholderia pseudomallei]|uniref:Membrane protein n=1 Tax=Burkholderia pseudomallei TaxID=28450 RepID=A0AA40JJI7_BURPE|nr:hypothetical protein [Burkholderia pseudomallei]KGS77553.1 putative membrane protein [Burkholderia pseudomallei MSHR5596]KGX17102.1 putative membrane protein [Burkholderia pseudomallei]